MRGLPSAASAFAYHAEINQVINRLIATQKRTILVLERLDFRVPVLLKRPNRIIQNCGRSVLDTKLAAIQQEFGIESTQVGSAYISQTGTFCGYVNKQNRRTQARFECLWRSNKIHADVYASRNIRSGRVRSFPVHHVLNLLKTDRDLAITLY